MSKSVPANRAERYTRIMKPYCIALDLEFNQPSQRIIQIGAVLGHLPSGQVHSRFSCFVNPAEPLSEHIAELCGIAPGVLDCAGSLEEAFAQLVQWRAPFAADIQRNPLTWGGADSDTLRQALGHESGPYVFGRRWNDVKTVYAAWCHANGREPQGGLAPSMKKFGLVFEGRKHDAMYDALNTFRMYVRLLQELTPAQI